MTTEFEMELEVLQKLSDDYNEVNGTERNNWLSKLEGLKRGRELTLKEVEDWMIAKTMML